MLLLRDLRTSLDEAGASSNMLLVAGDARFANRTLVGALLDRADLRCRTRKDAVLCAPALPGTRRRYGQEPFTPAQVQQHEAYPRQTTRLWHGGPRRTLRYQERHDVLWRGGAQTRRLRLLVVAPSPSCRSRTGRRYCRRAVYLLTSDRTTPAVDLLQVYLNRCEIEVNHCEEKATLGLGRSATLECPERAAATRLGGRRPQRVVTGQSRGL